LDKDQPPGTPADQCQSGVIEAVLGTSSSSSAFPPTTALVLVSRSGRPVGYRGRLYSGIFCAAESPDLLPGWVLDVVWNQKPPPEEVCSERALLFTVLRCSSELALPSLPTPFCVAAPRTRIRRLMAYLVRCLDFDWSSPAKAGQRRQPGAGAFVSRLGRCCVAPNGRGNARSVSADSCGGCSSDGESPRGRPRGPGGPRSRGGSAKRGRSSERPSLAGYPPSGGRRSFGLRGRGEEDAVGPSGAMGRLRIDGSPAPLPSVVARPQVGAAARRAPARDRGTDAADASSGRREEATDFARGLDEDCVEILCGGTVVDSEASLATIRDFTWRRPGVELVLVYRRRSPRATPAGGGALAGAATTAASAPESAPPSPPLLTGSGQDEGDDERQRGSSPGPKE